jgi:hypothetical protein
VVQEPPFQITEHPIEHNLLFQGGRSSQNGLNVRAKKECHGRADGKDERKDGIEYRFMQLRMIRFRHNSPKVGECRYCEKVGEIWWDFPVLDRRLYHGQQPAAVLEIRLDGSVKGLVQYGHAVPAAEGDKEDRLEESSIVVVPDALVHEEAMMVVDEDATVANLAVVATRWPIMVANFTPGGSRIGVDEDQDRTLVTMFRVVGGLEWRLFLLLSPLETAKPSDQRLFRRVIVLSVGF